MKHSLFKILIFIGLNALLLVMALLLVHWIEPKYERTNTTTEATFSAIPKNHKYDFVIMGTSHAREFSRSANHEMVEQLTGKTFFNLSKGAGHGGLIPNIMAWRLFLQRGNKTQHIIYFVDPWIFYSSKWNEENYCFEDEPVRPDILMLGITNGMSTGTIINYLKSKLKPSYLFAPQISSVPNEKSLTRADLHLIQKQIERNFPDTLSEDSFKKYSAIFTNFVNQLTQAGIRITFMLPPTLLTNEPGHEQTLQLLNSFANIPVYDHSRLITNPAFYYDHSHLNTAGIRRYVIENSSIFR